MPTVTEYDAKTGGIYLPPFKAARAVDRSPSNSQAQHEEWERIKKSLNALVNKVSVENIREVAHEIFSENLIRGMGLFSKAILRAQSFSPTFTDVFVSLVSVVNSRLPEVVELLLHRATVNLQRAIRRSDRQVTQNLLDLFAELINFGVLDESVASSITNKLLAEEDSIELCCRFLRKSCLTPRISKQIFDQLRRRLQRGSLTTRAQFSVEDLLERQRRGETAQRKIREELDLVDDDGTKHILDLDERYETREDVNAFRMVPAEQWEMENEKWLEIATEIMINEEPGEYQEEPVAYPQAAPLSDPVSLVELRKSVYLAIQSSLNFEECIHKILRLNIPAGQEKEVVMILVDACAQERTFNPFFALQGERLAKLKSVYRDLFADSFGFFYDTAHRLETSKIRNVSKFFAHLLMSGAIDWRVISQIVLTEESTTSSTRIFVKLLFQDIGDHWGLNKLKAWIEDPRMETCFRGLFVKDNVGNLKFGINFFTAIGLGSITEKARKDLKDMTGARDRSRSRDNQYTRGGSPGRR